MVEGTNKTQNFQNSVSLGTSDFESSLLKVLEQDGVVMSTPTGVKKRSRHLHQPAKKPSFVFEKPVIGQGADVAEKLDLEAVACIVKRHEEPVASSVAIKQQNHSRSPFVVSLREIPMSKTQDDANRVKLSDQAAYAETLSLPQSSSGAMASAALKSKISPNVKDEQVNKPRAASSALSVSLLGARLKRAGKKIFFTASKDLKKLEKKEQAVVKEVEREFEEAAEEVATAKFSFAKAAVGFFALAVVITLPAQALVAYRGVSQERGKVEEQGRQAVGALTSLAGDSGLNISVDKLQDASGKFREADRLLDESHLLAVGAAAFVPKQYKSAKALLEVGDKVGQAGQLLAMGFEKVFDGSNRGMIERLQVLGTFSRGVLPILSQAEQAAQSVDVASVPEAQRAQAQSLPDKISQAKESIREFAVLSDALIGFLGSDRQRTYLLVFQNQTELRPSGGFMGSVAEITVDHGEIVSVHVPSGGTYDLKGQLTERVLPPKPLQLINSLWQFQDANWFADFKQTAEKIRWFWSKSGQPTLDGVIAVNASFMEKVLVVTGPVELPEYGKTITADNFLIETQKAVEIEYDKDANTPKKFIGDLFTKLMERAKNLKQDDWLALAAASNQALETKEIQISMFDPDEEALVENFGWQGQLKPTSGDSLAVIAANIAGQKTDAVVDEKVNHVAEIQADGSIVDTLTIDRTHNGQKGELFRGVRNVQYLRVYVPKGAELLDAKGFEPPPENYFKKTLELDKPDPDLLAIENSAQSAMGTVWTAVEGDRTVFGGWLQLDPGKSQQIVLSYRLPFTVYDIMEKTQDSPDSGATDNVRAAYLMLLTSQSGKTRQLTQEVKLNAPWNKLWTRGDVGQATANEKIGWQGTWDRDEAVAVLLSNKDADVAQK
ncbi:MAG: DUF4012 domain-containing protein [Patescibacteria group bacterium]|jgi:hypothetical protein